MDLTHGRNLQYGPKFGLKIPWNKMNLVIIKHEFEETATSISVTDVGDKK